ncbi:hypothetical protein QR680_002545 [Steinernema hermaphroditum]|uniref:Uncharacterized protein n=1 Tax=Steinernema hermaphroditum TaxID=289476 RepID=A0AA39LIG8_9BILA|nr:hypothetical protein QR680_002545 [Steinernema hermaphroditum]
MAEAKCEEVIMPPSPFATTTVAVFRVTEIKEALLRVADPILCQVLAWLYTPDGGVPFMHDFPDAPISLEPEVFPGFMSNFIYSTVFDKDRDALANDIMMKMATFPEFLHISTLLYHQNFPDFALRDSSCYFLRTFVKIFRYAYERAIKKQPFKPAMLINFEQAQNISMYTRDAVTNVRTGFFADRDCMMFSFKAEHKDILAKLHDLSALLGLPAEGEFVPFFDYRLPFAYFEWTTTPSIPRLPSTMDRREMQMAFQFVKNDFEEWVLEHGDRVVHDILRFRNQLYLAPYRTQLTLVQFGGQIPVPPPDHPAADLY